MKQFRRCVAAIASLLICAIAVPARGGITVTSYTTTVETNAYAPFSKAQYFDQQTLTNVSPAVADVSDDWTGTNVGGSTATWHWIGASHIETSTASGSTSLTVTGAGSFSYDMTTTSAFVDPIRSGGVYTPGGAADYQCYFTLDTPATYRATGQIDGWGVAFLSSSEMGEFFYISSPGAIDRSGTIPAGHYEIRANASLSMGQLSSGVNHRTASGAFSDFNFSVQVPEPSFVGAMLLLIAYGRQRRGRR